MREVLEGLALWGWILLRLWAPVDLRWGNRLGLAWTAMALAYLAYLTGRHRYDARAVGFRLDNLGPAMKRMLPALAGFAVAVLAFAYPVHFQPHRMNPLLHWAIYFFWAVLQPRLRVGVAGVHCVAAEEASEIAGPDGAGGGIGLRFGASPESRVNDCHVPRRVRPHRHLLA